MVGIRFYFGYNSNPNKRIQKIRDYGFDAIITSPDKKYNKQNTSIKNQVKLAKENGLKLSSMHSTYKNELLHGVFERTEEEPGYAWEQVDDTRDEDNNPHCHHDPEVGVIVSMYQL